MKLVQKLYTCVVVLLLGVFVAGCAVTDPSDEDVIRDAIYRMNPLDRRSVNGLARRGTVHRRIVDRVNPKAGGNTPLGKLTCKKGESESTFFVTGNQIAAAFAGIRSSGWDGFGPVRDNLLRVMVEWFGIQGTFGPGDCSFSEEIEKAVKETAAESPEEDFIEPKQTRTIEALLLGVVSAAVLAEVAPALLPILCSLSVEAYCADEDGQYGAPPVWLDPTDPIHGDAP